MCLSLYVQQNNSSIMANVKPDMNQCRVDHNWDYDKLGNIHTKTDNLEHLIKYCHHWLLATATIQSQAIILQNLS